MPGRRRRPTGYRQAAGRSVEAATLTIEGLGTRGDGIARDRLGRIFVPFVLPGEKVRVRLGAKRADGRAAELIEVVEASPTRRAAPCPHFTSCGGCQLQHMTAAAEAAWKTDEIAGALRRRGIAGYAMRPIFTAPSASRRRARLHAVRRGDAIRFGYHGRAADIVVDVHDCPVLEPSLARLIPALRWLAEGLLPNQGAFGLTLTNADSGIDLTIEAVRSPDLATRETLARFAHDHDLARVGWSVEASDEPIAERRPVVTSFGGVAVKSPPRAFLQASRAGEAAIVAAVIDGLGAARRVVDLYAGLGTLTFPIAARSDVHAVDGDAVAMAALAAATRRNADIASRVSFDTRDLARAPLSAAELARFDAAVFDPPRAGAGAQAEALGESVIKNVVAVSCNPSTFARDAKILIDRGFALDWVQPIDQFVWSARIELVAKLSRRTVRTPQKS